MKIHGFYSQVNRLKNVFLMQGRPRAW